MKALNPTEVIDYICEADRGLKKEEQTIWKIRPLTAREDAFVSDSSMDADRKFNFGHSVLTSLHLGLTGAENFPALERDKKAADILPGIKPWKDESLSMIPRAVRQEIALAIGRWAALTEEERKNS